MAARSSATCASAASKRRAASASSSLRASTCSVRGVRAPCNLRRSAFAADNCCTICASSSTLPLETSGLDGTAGSWANASSAQLLRGVACTLFEPKPEKSREGREELRPSARPIGLDMLARLCQPADRVWDEARCGLRGGCPNPTAQSTTLTAPTGLRARLRSSGEPFCRAESWTSALPIRSFPSRPVFAYHSTFRTADTSGTSSFTASCHWGRGPGGAFFVFLDCLPSPSSTKLSLAMGSSV
mmetsp:Transcript_66450/g.117997  ORF Transcript_66450/g.117997 Transcript_66450/m.117997 type:complete len:243 (+) Transcript_66450:1257-1985(+)